MKKLVVIGGSAGSFNIVNSLLSALPSDFPPGLVICIHRLRNVRSGFADTLSVNCKLKVKEAYDKEKIEASTVYIAPSNYHLMVEEDNSFCLSVEKPVNHSRPSIDITMETAGMVYRENSIGILLSGANADGSNGMKVIHENKGLTIVQDPSDCEIKVMPEFCLNLFNPDYILNSNDIIQYLSGWGQS